jgi:hypothetical protein
LREIDLELVAVEAHRHVELEARADRPSPGTCSARNVTTPVVRFTTKRSAACSMPSTAISTVPATGRAMVRIHGANAEP